MHDDLKDPNYMECMRLKELGELDQYKGQDLAFFGGKLIGHNPDIFKLLEHAREDGYSGCFLYRVLGENETEEILDIATPFIEE